jgi:tetratricopeptide (TPR) repeat protein
MGSLLPVWSACTGGQATRGTPLTRLPNLILKIHQEQKQYQEAEPVYGAALGIYRKLAAANEAAYLPYVAGTLNNLGTLYRGTQCLKEAEGSFQEALTIQRKLEQQEAISQKSQ